MSSSTLRAILINLALVTGMLIICLALGLPILAVLPAGVRAGPPVWAFLSPLAAAAAALALTVHTYRAVNKGGPPSKLANLTGRLLLLYVGVATVTLLFGSWLEPHPLMLHRPYAIWASGLSLILVNATILRTLVLTVLSRELTRLGAQQKPARPGQGAAGAATRSRRNLAGVGILAIKPSLTIVAGATVLLSMTLIVEHVHSRALAQEEQQISRHLHDIHRLVEAQLAHLPRSRDTLTFVGNYPVSVQGVPLMTGPDGKMLTEAAGISRGSVLRFQPGLCEVGHRRHRCLKSRQRGDRWLVTLHPREMSEQSLQLSELNLDLTLLSLGFVAFAVLLGRSIGNDVSRDFQVMTNQLRAMSRQDELDLGREVTVTSIDEVGDLTTSLGKLRTRLERELSDHHESLRQVREADRIKNEFFSTISQELRTPLTTLSGYSQLLLEERYGDLSETHREDITSIYQGGQQLLALINDVIDISVIESGHLQLQLEAVRLDTLCRDVVKDQRYVLSQQDQPIELELATDEDLPWIRVDPRRLKQVVQNLLSNALKFTREGKICVEVRAAADDHIRLQVRDTGSGISSVDLPHLFDHYRQAGDLQSRRQGSGLGLAICKHLVDLHGGSIAVESEVDRGSSFTILLPTRTSADAAAERAS